MSGIEPRDVTVSFYNDPSPMPLPEPDSYYRGPPEFMSKYTEQIRGYVGETVKDVIRVKGAHPMTVTIKGSDPYLKKKFNDLATFQLSGSYAGFIVNIFLRCGGRHNLVYTVKNAAGKVPLRRDVIVTMRTLGG